ncbi:hypothetical protein JQ582_19835 [Bradyrhizobium japonicum]|uniref:hypothetical protein n=1 Tax=Bradyrhizobium japonicum TaxID=375 RepID=UPI001BA7118F|nr:hypothetical protein [Bradyrhizobium japonicum]MBR0746186.1 hypothetical protein [Bradyrhizobium japonicum]
MGKIDDPYTPEQRVLLQTFVRDYTPEERAALRIKRFDLTPPSRAKTEPAAGVSPDTGEKRGKVGKTKPAKRKAARKTSPARFQPQAKPVMEAARELWPKTKGKPPPDLSKPEIVRQINDACAGRSGPVSRNTVLRALGLLKR